VWCPRCRHVRREKLEWLATPPKFTQRFEDEIGYRLRDTPVSTVADLLDLSWDQVKRIEMAYMERLLKATPVESPRAIGVDEISIKKRHQYRIVVSDLERRRPIWFGGKDRSEDSFSGFFLWLNQHTERGAAGIEVAVMVSLSTGMGPGVSHEHGTTSGLSGMISEGEIRRSGSVFLFASFSFCESLCRCGNRDRGRPFGASVEETASAWRGPISGGSRGRTRVRSGRIGHPDARFLRFRALERQIDREDGRRGRIVAALTCGTPRAAAFVSCGRTRLRRRARRRRSEAGR
jgi:Helix-turn-helix domain of transposase family ISL3/Transposase